MATTSARLVAVVGLLGLTSACDVFIPDLGDPANVASMTARFKATIQAEDRSLAWRDWGVADGQIWRHYMGPRVVAFCGRPANAPIMQRAYQINFFRGAFGNIGELEVDTPAHPAENDPSSGFCGTRLGGL